MGTIDGFNVNNFSDVINLYKNKASDGKVNNNELNSLIKAVYQAGGNITPEQLKELNTLVLADNKIDENEKKFLIGMGAAANEASLTKEKINVKTHDTSSTAPVDSSVQNLISEGFAMRSKLGLKSVDFKQTTYDGAAKAVKSVLPEPVEGFLRDTGVVAFAKDIIMSPEEKKQREADIAASRQNTQRMETQASTIVNEINSFKGAGERSNCVSDVAKRIGAQELVGKDGFKITEDSLKQKTGKNWDTVIPAKYGSDSVGLANTLKGQENKAIVVLGTHSFVFNGIDKTGNMRLLDTSEGSKGREISVSPKTPQMSIFVQGAGDGAKTEGNRSDSLQGEFSVKNFSDFAKAPPTYLNDSVEGGNIRKLFVLLGDKDVGKLDNIYGAIKNKNLTALKSLLSEKGINIGEQELKAMCDKLNTKLNDGGTLINKLENLSKKDFSGDKVYYHVGIQQSPIDLTDYFTKTNPNDMNKVFNDMLQGKVGC